MLKKYAPYVLLALAATILLFVKSNQRGKSVHEKSVENIEVIPANEGFSRNPDNIIYTKHARCRMDCRHITETEVKEILQKGSVLTNKIEEDDRGKTYPLEGKTSTDKFVRVVVAPKKNDIVIVTVIDLDKEWLCDCH